MLGSSGACSSLPPPLRSALLSSTLLSSVRASFGEQHTVGAECERAELRPRPQDKTELDEVLQIEEEAEIRP